MPKIDHDTKEKILKAAEKVFHRNGFKGTRTSLIASEAGISRTMLHYYFSTKEALFQAVLQATFGAVLAHLKKPIMEAKSLEAVLENLVDVVSNVLADKPDLPSFIVNILNETPEMAHFMAATTQDDLPAQLDKLLDEAKKQGAVAEDVTGEDLILNLYAICSFPYLTMPYIAAKAQRDPEAMRAFLRERRAKNLRFLLKSIKNDK